MATHQLNTPDLRHMTSSGDLLTPVVPHSHRDPAHAKDASKARPAKLSTGPPQAPTPPRLGTRSPSEIPSSPSSMQVPFFLFSALERHTDLQVADTPPIPQFSSAILSLCPLLSYLPLNLSITIPILLPAAVPTPDRLLMQRTTTTSIHSLSKMRFRPYSTQPLPLLLKTRIRHPLIHLR
jgi:hypothetical protein